MSAQNHMSIPAPAQRFLDDLSVDERTRITEATRRVSDETAAVAVAAWNLDSRAFVAAQARQRIAERWLDEAFDALQPRDRLGRWKRTFTALARKEGALRGKGGQPFVPGGTSIAATPFRGAGKSQGSDYFDTPRFKGYMSAVSDTMAERKGDIVRFEESRGIWDGGSEPSTRIELADVTEDEMVNMMDWIGSNYQQDGVIGFIPHRDGNAHRFTTDPVPADTIDRILGDYPNVQGATHRPDGRLEILSMPHEHKSMDDALAELIDIERLLKALDVPVVRERGIGLLRLAGDDYTKRPRPARRAVTA